MRKYYVLILGILLNISATGCGLLSSSNNNGGGGTQSTGGTTGTGGGTTDGNQPSVNPNQDPNTAGTTPFAGMPYRFVGRIVPGAANPNAPQTMSWGNSAVVARFTGTEVTVNLKRPDNNNTSFFVVDVDGKVVATLDPNTSTYTANNLAPNTPHEVRLVKRNEADYGTAQFNGFTLGTGGAFLQPQPAAHRIEFVGDSISNGYGDLGGTNANCHGDFNNEDTTQAYGPQTGDLLNADVMVSAWSGKGVIVNNDTTKTDLMPALWMRGDATDANSTWDFSTWTPDVVVVNLGTNDFSNGVPVAAQFDASFGTFVQTIRSKYANARIYIAIGPMLADPDRAQALADLQAIVSASNALPNGNLISLVDFGTQMVDQNGNGAACDWHPTLAEHKQMATKLSAQIKTDMGW